ncbi:MAG: Na+/H+ antiporter NhaA, partial [Actinomycetota bacterium]|nr:Na+/H+ antiporter NhaA [Actinomycetota bacterium]
MLGRAVSVTKRTANRAQEDFHRFLALEVSGGVVLLVAAIIALIAANSPLADSYARLWEIPISISIGGWHISESLIGWIDDGLMALFFFVVGLEIKREVLVGELSSARKAALPIIAAIGGMLAPALIYILFNRGTSGAAGWGIPMATDIAFALGVLALLGSAVPVGLKVFLTALAIADDIGAII